MDWGSQSLSANRKAIRALIIKAREIQAWVDQKGTTAQAHAIAHIQLKIKKAIQLKNPEMIIHLFESHIVPDLLKLTQKINASRFKS